MTALVVNVDGSFADIEFHRHTACDKCGMCGGAKRDDIIRMRVENACGAAVGDRVQIEAGSNGFGAVGLAYGLPLLFMVICAGAGYVLGLKLWPGNVDMIVLGGCIMGVVIGFVLIRFLGRKGSRAPKAVAVVKECSNQ